MLLTFGDDNQLGLGLPRDATHIRVTPSQGARISVQWAGSRAQTTQHTLTRGSRADVAVPNDHTGVVIMARHEAAGPVYLTWVVPR